MNKLSCTIQLHRIEQHKNTFIDINVSDKYPKLVAMLNAMYQNCEKLPGIGVILPGKHKLKVIDKKSDSKYIIFVVE